jgi:pimeloyl-ACP methyl ester carboxylesterase
MKIVHILRTSMAVLALVTSASSAAAYEFPIEDPFAATVIGTPTALKAQVPMKIPGEARTLEVSPTADIPDVFWYERGLKFGFVPQHEDGENARPLIFIIAGTGAHYRSEKVVALAKAFYQAGFHIISISSPTQLNFLVNASSTHLPGFPGIDVADLYRVMGAAYEQVRDEINVSEFYLTGYSLGGLQAAFLAKLDAEHRKFDFKKILMINPAVNLYASVEIMDALLTESVPGGVDGVGEFLNRAIERLAQLYHDDDDLRLDGDFIYKIYQETEHLADVRGIPQNARPQNAKALIAIAFRIASASMVFGADVINRSGYIVSPSIRLGKYDSLTKYSRASHRVQFTEYVNDMVLPVLKERYPDKTRDELIASAGLPAIEDYLANATHIRVVTNEDEIILAPGELDYMKQLFGSRIKTYPRGGHCGNMDHHENVRYMVDFFAGEGS